MTREEEQMKIDAEIEQIKQDTEIPAPVQPEKQEEEKVELKSDYSPEQLAALQNAEGTPEKQELMDRIQRTLNKIRPYIQADGGDVELIDYKDGIVTVSMLGACAGCMAIDATLTDGIQAIVLDEVPEVKRVQLLESNPFGYSQI